MHSRSGAFSRDLAARLEGGFGATLAGSWSTAEGHWPVDCIADSYSDVDVLVPSPQDAHQCASAIRVSVLESASKHGIWIGKVSVRTVEEIDGFWSPTRVRSFARDRAACGNYMVFWALVGMLECCTDAFAVDQTKRSYVAAKLIFKMGRNIVLLRRATPTGYQRLCRQMHAAGFDLRALKQAYEVKVGRRQVLAHAACETLLGGAAWGIVERDRLDDRSSALLARLRQAIVNWHAAGTSIDAPWLLKELRRIEAGPELEPARRKVVRDHG